MTVEDYRAGFAEFVGTMLFVFLGAGVVVASGIAQQGPQAAPDRLLVIATGHGLAYAAAVWAAGPVSGGHINPAVTLAAWLTGKVELQRGVLYVVAQLLGAVVGAALLAYITGQNADLGQQTLSTSTDAAHGLVTELILSAALVGVIFMTAFNPRGPGNVAALAIGITLLVAQLAGWQLTGASMNPARTFGPAVVTGIWADHWIYWVAPLLGGAIAGVIANQVFLKAETQ